MSRGACWAVVLVVTLVASSCGSSTPKEPGSMDETSAGGEVIFQGVDPVSDGSGRRWKGVYYPGRERPEPGDEPAVALANGSQQSDTPAADREATPERSSGERGREPTASSRETTTRPDPPPRTEDATRPATAPGAAAGIRGAVSTAATTGTPRNSSIGAVNVEPAVADVSRGVHAPNGTPALVERSPRVDGPGDELGAVESPQRSAAREITHPRKLAVPGKQTRLDGNRSDTPGGGPGWILLAAVSMAALWALTSLRLALAHQRWQTRRLEKRTGRLRRRVVVTRSRMSGAQARDSGAATAGAASRRAEERDFRLRAAERGWSARLERSEDQLRRARQRLESGETCSLLRGFCRSFVARETDRQT